MAKGDSSIVVRIQGDINDITGKLKALDTKLGTFGRVQATVGRAFAGGIDEVFSTINDALGKADDFNDALGNIAGQISPEFAQRIHDISGDFTDIGVSSVDVAKMADAFASLATAAGVSQPAIEQLTPKLIDVAKAVSAQTDKPLSEVVNDIGAAARGNQRAVNDYGLVIDKTLNPDANILSILDQLQKKYGDAASATSDFKGQQDQLNAKWDTFLEGVGEGLQGPLAGVLDFFNHVLDDIPRTVKGFQDLAAGIVDFGRTVLGPLGNVNDVLGGIGDAIGNIGSALGILQSKTDSERAKLRDIQNYRERNGLPDTLGRN